MGTKHLLNLSFPLATLFSLPRPTSDHTPLLLSLSTSLPKAGFFRFEKFWLHNQSFLPSVLPAWEQAPVRDDAVGQLAACIKSTRSAAKVWSRRIRAPPFLIRNFQFLVQLFDYFEETRPLSSSFRFVQMLRVLSSGLYKLRQRTGVDGASTRPSRRLTATQHSTMLRLPKDSGGTSSAWSGPMARTLSIMMARRRH